MKVLVLTLLATIPLSAQWRHFGSDHVQPTGFFGAGFTEPLNPVARALDTGWNVSGGVGVTGKYVGVLVDAMYTDFGLNRATLARVGVPRGDQEYWAVTLDPIVHVNPHGPVDFYITGGGGIYSQKTQFKLRGGRDDVLYSDTLYKPGVDGGVGFAFHVGYQIKIFAEARYHYMFTHSGASFIPVSFGVRF